MDLKKNIDPVIHSSTIEEFIQQFLIDTGSIKTIDLFMELSKNHIAILSEDGLFKKISSSLSSLLGYSEEELRSIPIKDLAVTGDFRLENKATNYYFENRICGKSNISKVIRWRLLPDVLDNVIVLVGWEVET